MATWEEGGYDEAAALPGHVLHVGDGHLGHFRPLADHELVSVGLKDYAASYEADGPDVTCKVSWTLFVDGVEASNGEWRFRSGS